MPDIGLGELTAAAFVVYLIVVALAAIPARRRRRAEPRSLERRELREAGRRRDFTPTADQIPRRPPVAKEPRRREFEHERDECTGEWATNELAQMIRCDCCGATYPNIDQYATAAVHERFAGAWLKEQAEKGRTLVGRPLDSWQGGGPR